MVNGESYYLYNTAKGMFLTNGNDWGTHASLGMTGLMVRFDNLTTEELTAYSEETDVYTLTMVTSFKGTNNASHINTYVFRDNDAGDIYLDMGSQDPIKRHFLVEAQGNGCYRIHNNRQNTFYGEDVLGANYAIQYWGWPGAGTKVMANIDPATGNADWQLISSADYDALDAETYAAELDLYNARLNLYKVAKNIVANEFTIDYEAYTEAYNGTDIDAINAAIEALTVLYDQAMAYKILEGATEDNPKDGTSLIKNPSFDGNIEGWTCTFVSGTNASNVGYQSSKYTNGEVTISQFIEAWTNATYSSACSWAAIGDGELSQTLKELPLGKYSFSCDAIAVAQWGNPNPVTGVQLFATGGDIDTYAPIATGDGLPEHVELTFVSTGGDTKLGLRTKNGTANWIAADNFTLTYYGPVDPYQVALQDYINNMEATYPDLNSIYANQEVKTAYETALNNGYTALNNETGYEDAYKALVAAKEDLAASIVVYENLNTFNTNWQEKLNDLAGTKWEDAASACQDKLDEMTSAYEEGTYTPDDIVTAEDELTKTFAEQIGALVTKGDDLTFLLVNPGFESDFSGWNLTETSATPKWSGKNVVLKAGSILKDGTEVEEDITLESGNAEIYHVLLDMSQTIKNMPAGFFTFSCQAFERDDNNKGVDAELFAIVGDSTNIQTVKITNLTADGSEVQLYDGTTGDVLAEPDNLADVQSGERWIPNGMNGANVYFAAGYYKNAFNIELTEPTDITVGIRTASDGDWVLFDDFKIVYKGYDSEAFKTQLEELKSAAEAMTTDDSYTDTGLKKNILTKQAIDSLNNTITDAEDMLAILNEVTVDEAKVMVQRLQDAIALANEAIAATTKLQNRYVIESQYRVGLVSSSDTKYPALLEEVSSYVGESYDPENAPLADVQEVEAYLQRLSASYTNYVMCDLVEDATEDSPADVTAVIYNPDNTEYGQSATSNGWNHTETIEEGANGGFGYGNSAGAVSEFYNCTYDLNQTIYNVVPGYYRLEVQGFYRDSTGTTRVNKEDLPERKHAVLYANDAETYLLPISHDMVAFKAIVEANGVTEGIATVTIDEETSYAIPDQALTAATALENELYNDTLQFQVPEGTTDLVIGLRKTVAVTGDWTVWKNWRLEYLGTTAPTTDPTTAIKGVETTPVAAEPVIYTLTGQRVSKAVRGLYIINGKKILVK